MSSNQSLILRKMGNFYYGFDEDAYIISNLFNYKITEHRCGFPLNSLSKIIKVLEEKQINYIIREDEDTIKDFSKQNNYQKYLDESINKITTTKRIHNILNILSTMEENKKEEILTMIENKIKNNP